MSLTIKPDTRNRSSCNFCSSPHDVLSIRGNTTTIVDICINCLVELKIMTKDMTSIRDSFYTEKEK